MKKTLMTLMLAITIALLSNELAQGHHAERTSGLSDASLKLGLNLANFRGDDVDEDGDSEVYNSRFSLLCGIGLMN